MVNPTVAAGKSTNAIGRPDARLFFEPQNSNTIASPRSSRANLPTTAVQTSTTASSTAATAVTETNCHGSTLLQIPCTTPIAKAVYRTSRMDPRSTTFSSTPCRVRTGAKKGRAIWPNVNGSKSCSMISMTALPCRRGPRPVCIISSTNSGVSTTPTMLDNEALTIAAETWPRAIEVNAMDDCTVDGTRHRNRTPLYKSVVSTEGTNARAASPSTGKTTKVVLSTNRCSRHWRTPRQACCGDNRAP